MTTRGQVNSNFYQIVNTDSNANPTQVKPEYITELNTLPNLTVSGNVVANLFIGNVQGNISGNIVVPGSNTDVIYNNQGNAGASNSFQFDTDSNTLTVLGPVYGNTFIGDGGNLSNLNVSNVTGLGNIAVVNLDGNVSNVLSGTGTWIAAGSTGVPNYANFAGTAFSVDGGNVSGTVANANYATNAGLATYATTANSVAGSNVSGQVSYAAVANSVAVANVVGIGNIAITNYDGNAQHVLYGNGSWANIPTVTNVANANYSNFAGTAYSVDAANIVGVVNLANYATIANSVAGSNVVGDVSGANHSNVSDLANSVAVANVVGIGNVATVNLDGNVSNVLAGDGSWQPAGSTGVPNYANFAGTAFSVSASNITGVVNLANYATVANSVAGSNVVGDVSGANHSNVSDLANSVVLANVVGIGNIATVNLDGNSSKVLSGTGTWIASGGTPTEIASGNTNVAITGGGVINFTSNGTTYTNIGTNGNINTANLWWTGTIETGTQNSQILFAGGGSNSGVIFASEGNITGANIISGKQLTSSGNVTGGNIITSGLISAGGNITGGLISATGNITGSLISATGNITGGNITTAGTLSVTGNANISNLQLNKFEEVVYAFGNASGTITPDFNNGSIQSMTVTGNITLNSLANATTGRSMTMILKQDTTGNRILTTTMKFAGGSNALSTTASATDIISVFYDGSTYWAALSKGYV